MYFVIFFSVRLFFQFVQVYDALTHNNYCVL